MSQLPVASPQNSVPDPFAVNVPPVVWNVADVMPAGIAAVTVVSVLPTFVAVKVPPPSMKLAAVAVIVAAVGSVTAISATIVVLAANAVVGFTCTPLIVAASPAPLQAAVVVNVMDVALAIVPVASPVTPVPYTAVGATPPV